MFMLCESRSFLMVLQLRGVIVSECCLIAKCPVIAQSPCLVVALSSEDAFTMRSVEGMGSSGDDVLRLFHFPGSSVNDEQKLVRRQRSLIFDNAVFGNANAHQGCSERTYTAH